MASLEFFRQEVLEQLLIFDTFGIFQKLLLNHNLKQSPEGLLRTLGWVHLYSASGIHIYALLESLEWSIGRIPYRTRFITEIKFLIRILLYGMLGFLWALQEFRFGFLRPLFTFALRQIGAIAGWRWNPLSPLLITLLMDLSIGTAVSGRLHYYLAIGGGIVTLQTVRHVKKTKEISTSGLLDHFILAFGSWIWIAAVELAVNHQIAPWTAVFSLITFPVFCSIIYPLLVLSLLIQRFDLIVKIGSFGTDLLNLMLVKFDQWHLSFYVITAPAVGLSIVLAILFSVLFFNTRSRVVLAFLFLLSCIGLRFSGIAEIQTAQVTQINVGQGDAALLQFGPRAEMVDVGSGRSLKIEDWIHVFSKAGVTKIDGVLLSHLDEDHQGMLKTLFHVIPIHCIETHTELLNTKKGRMLQTTVPLSSASCMRLGEHVWLPGGKHGKGNELMAGTLFPLNDKTVYLAAGDADTYQESAFLKWALPKVAVLPNRIWKVSHHGSRFSSSKVLLTQLSPKVAWISVGRNHYGHPHSSILWRFQNLNIPVYRTDVGGDLKSNATQSLLERIIL